MDYRIISSKLDIFTGILNLTIVTDSMDSMNFNMMITDKINMYEDIDVKYLLDNGLDLITKSKPLETNIIRHIKIF